VINLTNVESIYTHFIWDLFEIKSLNGGIILQSKKDSLVGNYLAEQERFINKKYLVEQEKYKFHYFKSNPLM
jgi:hypothetical protein